MSEHDARRTLRRRFTAPRVVGLFVALLIVVASAGFTGSASAATSARTCKVVTVVTHPHHRTVRRRARLCETATISLTTRTIPSGGGTFTLRYAATNWTSCTLAASPAFWVGRNPTRVNCRDGYTSHVPSTVNGRSWTFRFTARNRYGELATVAIVLRQQALQQPVVQQTANWSGYVLEGTGLYAAQGTFNVPNLSPTAGATATSEWVGIDGNSNNSLIQAGVHEGYDPVSNTVLIYPWWEILPAPETPILSMTVNPGDSVTVTIARFSGTTWGIEVADKTTGQDFTTYQYYAGPETSAEWIVEAPSLLNGSIEQLGVFTPNVTFSGLGSNGNKVLVDELFMVQNGAIVASPSGVDANGFTVAYGPIPPPAP